MTKAIWQGTVLAESSETIMVEGTPYFPPASLNQTHFVPSNKTTVCSWKGTATYFSIQAGDQVNADAAWVYRDPKPAAAEIKDHVAFWRGVEVVA